MPFTLIMFILFALITLGLLAIARSATPTDEELAAHKEAVANNHHYKDPDPPLDVPASIALVPAAIALLFLLWACLAFVPTRNIGVITSFGKPVGTHSNGVHIKAPWQKVKTLDGTIQTNNRTGSDAHPTGDDGQSCSDIRIGNGSTACVDNSVRWRIRLEAGQRLYQDYPKGMDAITDSLVARELKSALNEVLGQYNPLDQIEAKSSAAVAPNLNEFATKVEAALRTRVGSDVEIKSVILPIIRFDKQTQSKINAYQAEVANTRIAQQSEKTAEAQARANENLKASVDNNPNVLVARCLDTLAEMVKAKQKVPVGFTCWPGTNSPVIAQIK